LKNIQEANFLKKNCSAINNNESLMNLFLKLCLGSYRGEQKNQVPDYTARARLDPASTDPDPIRLVSGLVLKFSTRL